MKPAGVPAAFWVDVEPAADVEPVDAVAAAVAVGAALVGGDDDVAAGELGVDAGVVDALEGVASLAPVTPALRGDEEL